MQSQYTAKIHIFLKKIMLATIHQKNIEKIFESEKILSLESLKKAFVETKTMNTTTLYRILDRWKEAGKIHEIEINKNRVFIYCEHAHKNEGIQISYCTNCSGISESHFPLPKNALKAEKIEYLKCCEECEK